MSHEVISIVTAFSIVFASILGIIRFRQVQETYYPFFYICWLALVAEAVAYLVQVSNDTFVPSNIYVLLESMLFVWLFQRWGSFRDRPFMFYALLAAICLLWMSEAIYLSGVHKLFIYYRIVSSGILTILSVDQINKLIITERKSFLRNAKFLICICVLIFFSYKLISEVFYMTVTGSKNREFLQNVYRLQQYVNLFINLLFAYVMIWIPRKKVFLEPLPS